MYPPHYIFKRYIYHRGWFIGTLLGAASLFFTLRPNTQGTDPILLLPFSTAPPLFPLNACRGERCGGLGAAPAPLLTLFFTHEFFYRAENALRDVKSATGQLQALQAAAKVAGYQAIALQQIISLLGIWMDMQAQHYVDQANKEAAREAAWKKQTKFDPSAYVPETMRLRIK